GGLSGMHGEAFAPQTGRWGDYSDLTVDPVDDCTFWYTNEYAQVQVSTSDSWHTVVGNFKFAQCTPRRVGVVLGTVTDSGTGYPLAGVAVAAGGYSAFTNADGHYQFSPLAPGSYNVTATQQGYFSNSASGVSVTNAGVTVHDFALDRNSAEQTPTASKPTISETINPSVHNAAVPPGSTHS